MIEQVIASAACSMIDRKLTAERCDDPGHDADLATLAATLQRYQRAATDPRPHRQVALRPPALPTQPTNRRRELIDRTHFHR